MPANSPISASSCELAVFYQTGSLSVAGDVARWCQTQVLAALPQAGHGILPPAAL